MPSLAVKAAHAGPHPRKCADLQGSHLAQAGHHALRLEERAGVRAPSSHTAARPTSQVGTQKIWLSTVWGSLKTPISFSVARPNSTVDSMRAQCRPWLSARAIHSHPAITTRTPTIPTVIATGSSRLRAARRSVALTSADPVTALLAATMPSGEPAARIPGKNH